MPWFFAAWYLLLTFTAEANRESAVFFHRLGIAPRVAVHGTPPKLRLVVQLWQQGTCLIAPPGMRVVANGESLSLKNPGGTRSPATVFGQIPNCEPVVFESEPIVEGPILRERLSVEMGGRKAYVEIDALSAQRSARIITGDVLVPGRPTIIEWLPRTDVWPDRTFGDEVRIEGESGERITVEPPNLRVKAGRYEFVMPEMRSGFVSISLRTAAGPRARIVRCRGFFKCSTDKLGDTSAVRARVASPDPTAR